jgi:hypothetical protein
VTGLTLTFTLTMSRQNEVRLRKKERKKERKKPQFPNNCLEYFIFSLLFLNKPISVWTLLYFLYCEDGGIELR